MTESDNDERLLELDEAIASRIGETDWLRHDDADDAARRLRAPWRSEPHREGWYWYDSDQPFQPSRDGAAAMRLMEWMREQPPVQQAEFIHELRWRVHITPPIDDGTAPGIAHSVLWPLYITPQTITVAALAAVSQVPDHLQAYRVTVGDRIPDWLDERLKALLPQMLASAPDHVTIITADPFSRVIAENEDEDDFARRYPGVPVLSIDELPGERSGGVIAEAWHEGMRGRWDEAADA